MSDSGAPKIDLAEEEKELARLRAIDVKAIDIAVGDTIDFQSTLGRRQGVVRRFVGYRNVGHMLVRPAGGGKLELVSFLNVLKRIPPTSPPQEINGHGGPQP